MGPGRVAINQSVEPIRRTKYANPTLIRYSGLVRPVAFLTYERAGGTDGWTGVRGRVARFGSARSWKGIGTHTSFGLG